LNNIFEQIKISMKTIVLFFGMIIFIACNSDSKKTGSKADNEKGLALVGDPNNKCLTCHNIETAVTGPSYLEVANRYAGRPDTIVAHLAQKVIKGGKGEWGETWMTPNAVSQEDAEAMVRYILSLKK
jgi:cytochrome c